MKTKIKKNLCVILSLLIIFSALVFTTSAASLGKVKTLTVTETDDDEIDIKWSKVSGATGYRVYYKTANGSWAKFNTKKTSTDLEKLKSATTYQIKVRAYKKSGSKVTWGTYSPTVKSSTEPAKVKNLKISTTSSSKAKLTWSAVTGATGYQIYRSTGSSYSKLTTVTAKSATVSYKNGYKFKVRAYRKLSGKNYFGDFSAVVTATKKSSSGTSTSSLAKVNNLRVTEVDDDEIDIVWSKVSGAAGYRVYYKTTNGSWVKFNTKKTSADLERLKSGTTYQIKIRAYKTSGGKKVYGSYSSTLKVSTEPAEVRNLKISSTSSSKAKLTWSAVTGATGYQIYRSTGSSYSKLTTVTGTSATVNTKNGYRFKVRAYRNLGGNTYYGDFSSYVVSGGSNNIDSSKAKSIALNHAGVSSSAVRELDVELERTANGYVYEVDFEAGAYEYEYVINAQTGSIVRSHREHN